MWAMKKISVTLTDWLGSWLNERTWKGGWGSASVHGITNWWASGKFPCKEWQGAYLIFLWMRTNTGKACRWSKDNDKYWIWCVSHLEQLGSLGTQSQRARYTFYCRVRECRHVRRPDPFQNCRKAGGGPAMCSAAKQIWASCCGQDSQRCPGMRSMEQQNQRESLPQSVRERPVCSWGLWIRKDAGKLQRTQWKAMGITGLFH